jgi:hypothetical protein
MTACATLMPTKANAATLTVTSVGPLQKNPGDSIEFIFVLNSAPSSVNVLRFLALDYNYDDSELSLSGVNIVPLNTIVNNTTTIASLTFDVLGAVKDGSSDLFNAKVYYQENDVLGETSIASGGDVEPVPEPLTMFAAATALGYGALFKRKYSKKKNS